MKRINKKSVMVGAIIGSLLGLTITAVAYWTSTGSTSSSATTGSASNWTVENTSNTGGPLYPGSGAIVVNYKVTNESDGHQGLNAVAVTLDQDGSGDVVVADGSDVDTDPDSVTGCKASWFSVVDNFAGTLDLAGHDDHSDFSTVSLDNLTDTNQDACQNVSPLLTISAS